MTFCKTILASIHCSSAKTNLAFKACKHHRAVQHKKSTKSWIHWLSQNCPDFPQFSSYQDMHIPLNASMTKPDYICLLPSQKVKVKEDFVQVGQYLLPSLVDCHNALVWADLYLLKMKVELHTYCLSQCQSQICCLPFQKVEVKLKVNLSNVIGIQCVLYTFFLRQLNLH